MNRYEAARATREAGLVVTMLTKNLNPAEDVVEEGGRVVGQVGKVEQRRRLDAYKGRRQLVKEAL